MPKEADFCLPTTVLVRVRQAQRMRRGEPNGPAHSGTLRGHLHADVIVVAAHEGLHGNARGGQRSAANAQKGNSRADMEMRAAGIRLAIVGVLLLVLAVLQHALIIRLHVGHLATYATVVGVLAIAGAPWLVVPSLRKAA